MARGTRGGSNDTALPNISTSDTIAAGDYAGTKIQVVIPATGPDTAPIPVTAAAPLPVVQTGTSALPTGAATSALQTSTETLVGGVTETAPATDTASSGLNGRLQRIAQRLSSAITLLGGGLPTALVGDRLKVDGSGVTQPVSGTVTVNALPAGTNNIGDVDIVTMPAVTVTGVATEATLDVRSGALTEVAPATDTASSGLNGRLQRIAQRLTSLIALLPAALGAGGGLKVDGSGTALPVSGTVTVNALPAGTNNIGDVDVLTLPALVAGTANIGDVDVLTLPAIPAGTNAIGKLAANSGVDIGDVDVTSLPALPTGTNAIGAVTSRLDQTRISVTPTVSTSPAYTAKDAVGGLLTFANAARVAGGTILIQTVVIIDDSQQMPALDLVLFDRTFTAPTDNAIFAPTDAELENTIGTVKVVSTDWADFSTNASATRTGLAMAAKLDGTSLFGALVARGTPTFVATTDISVIVEVLRD